MNDARPPGPDRPKGTAFSRRRFLQGMGAVIGGATVAPEALGRTEGAGGPPILGPGPVPVTFALNGRKTTASVEPRVTLLDTLRNHLDLTGAKRICDRGACGGCTVQLDGLPVNSCLLLAVDVEGRRVDTVEGLQSGDTLHPVQAAFIEHDALQCGFCTPGMVMAVKSCLDRHPDPTLEDVRRATSGNLCRCGTYPRVFSAALDAAARLRKRG